MHSSSEPVAKALAKAHGEQLFEAGAANFLAEALAGAILQDGVRGGGSVDYLEWILIWETPSSCHLYTICIVIAVF